MSAALIPTDAILAPADIGSDPPRHKFTRKEAEQLVEAGVLDGRRLELIDGDLIDKMGQKPLHAVIIQFLLSVFARMVDPKLIRIQGPMEAAPAERERSLPEPDVLILREWKSDYVARFPGGDEVVLAVEVSDTTIRFDLSRKASLYAQSGVPEYWVLDANGRRIIAHRQPRDGEYKAILIFNEGDSLTLENRSENIAVSDLFPTAPDTAL